MRYLESSTRRLAGSCRLGGLLLALLTLSGCMQMNSMRRDLMSKPYDAPNARVEAAAIDPNPLRILFPDMAPPPRKQEDGSYLRSQTAGMWSWTFNSRLSVAAAPMCWGGLYEFNSAGVVSLMHYSMALQKGDAQWLFSEVDWIAPYNNSGTDGYRVGDIPLHKEVVQRLPDSPALQAIQSRMAELDPKRYGGVRRGEQYLIVEKPPENLRICRFSVTFVENQTLGLPALVRHRSDITGVPASTTVFEHALDIFPRDEDLRWFFAHEYASGIVYLNFGQSKNRDLRKRFSAAVDGAVERMAKSDGIDPDRVEGKIFRDNIYTYYLAVYIGHNAGLDIADYLSELRVTDSRMLRKVDPKVVEYRERLIRHWWDKLRAEHAAGQLVKPDPIKSAASLEALQ